MRFLGIAKVLEKEQGVGYNKLLDKNAFMVGKQAVIYEEDRRR